MTSIIRKDITVRKDLQIPSTPSTTSVTVEKKNRRKEGFYGYNRLPMETLYTAEDYDGNKKIKEERENTDIFPTRLPYAIAEANYGYVTPPPEHPYSRKEEKRKR